MWVSIKPAQARREAADALERARRGIDPTSEKKQRRTAAQADTFGALVALPFPSQSPGTKSQCM
jgi:hypothetical protein